MLIPVRVSYTYELNQAIPKINEYKVYSKLKKPINISNSQTEGLPMISGINAIMDETGKIIGELKEAIKEAILEGEIQNNKEEALSLMYKLAKTKGLDKVSGNN